VAGSPILRFRDDVELAEAADEQLTVRWPVGRVTLKRTGDGLVAAVRALAGGAAEPALADLAADDGPTAIARLYLHLHRFGQLGLLEYAVVADGRPLATLVPISAEFELRRRSLEAASCWVLYQTLYLVATAMGLGPCAVGGGKAELLSRAIGTDYLVESAVGEFLLGSRPSG
jgi:hypothetical protein